MADSGTIAPPTAVVVVGAAPAVLVEAVDEVKGEEVAELDARDKPVKVPASTGSTDDAVPVSEELDEVTARLPPAVGNTTAAPVDVVATTGGAVVAAGVVVAVVGVAETVAGIDVVAPLVVAALT